MSTESLTSQDLMILRDLIMRRPSNDKGYAIALAMMQGDGIDATNMRIALAQHPYPYPEQTDAIHAHHRHNAPCVEG